MPYVLFLTLVQSRKKTFTIHLVYISQADKELVRFAVWGTKTRVCVERAYYY